MKTEKIEQYLKTLEKGFGRDNLLAVLSGEKMKQNPSVSPSSLHQSRLKLYIQECLPSPGQASVKKIAEKCYQLVRKMKEEITDPEISAKLQEFIEVTTEEHIISGLGFFLDELEMKNTSY